MHLLVLQIIDFSLPSELSIVTLTLMAQDVSGTMQLSYIRLLSQTQPGETKAQVVLSSKQMQSLPEI